MGAKFPIMQKCDVNGEKAHPVFKTLRKQTECFYNSETGKIKNIPWNFSKFVIDSEGKVVMYGNPRESLYRYIDEIEAILGLKGDSKEAKRALKKLVLSTKNAHEVLN
jgi:glutathione peroxidase